jgi:hypothetical protein
MTSDAFRPTAPNGNGFVFEISPAHAMKAAALVRRRLGQAWAFTLANGPTGVSWMQVAADIEGKPRAIFPAGRWR